MLNWFEVFHLHVVFGNTRSRFTSGRRGRGDGDGDVLDEVTGMPVGSYVTLSAKVFYLESMPSNNGPFVLATVEYKDARKGWGCGRMTMSCNRRW